MLRGQTDRQTDGRRLVRLQESQHTCSAACSVVAGPARRLAPQGLIFSNLRFDAIPSGVSHSHSFPRTETLRVGQIMYDGKAIKSCIERLGSVTVLSPILLEHTKSLFDTFFLDKLSTSCFFFYPLSSQVFAS